MIFSISQGYQTNSSSYHAVIFKYDRYDNLNEYLPQYDACFSNEHFVLLSQTEKFKFLLATLRYQTYEKEILQSKKFKDLLNQNKEFKHILQDYYLIRNTEDSEWYCDKYYIDHQSINEIDKKIFELLFLELPINENLIVVGNSDGAEDLPDWRFNILEMTDNDVKKIDKTFYGYRVFFNHSDRNFLPTIFRINDKIYGSPNHPAYMRELINTCIDYDEIDIPEALDLKISSYCEFNCPFCYQKSDQNGKHVSWYELQNYLKTLESELPYMQIAIGGGELKFYPDLDKILNFANETNLILNFTTADLLTAINIGSKISNFERVGLSITQHSNMDLIKHQLNSRAVLSDFNTWYGFCLHIIPELFKTEDDFLQRIAAFKNLHIGYSILCLGLKETRVPMKSYSPLNIQNLVDNEFYTENLYFDTLMVRKCWNQLNGKYYPDRLFVHEGIFSKYVDLEEKFVAPSSYETEYRKYFKDEEQLIKLLKDPFKDYHKNVTLKILDQLGV